MNARALDHKGMMVDVYSKLKPDSFTSQLQTVLTTYYEDIMGVQGASGCNKAKVVKRKFEDQDDTEVAQDADAADAAADTPATPPARDGGAAPAPGGEGPAPAHSPGGKSGGAKAARGAVLRGVARPKADAD